MEIKDYKRIVLEKDDSAKNQHKFYIVSEIEHEKKYRADWGRKGRPSQGNITYSYIDVKKKLSEKVKKGYRVILKENKNSSAYMAFLKELGDGWDLPD